MYVNCRLRLGHAVNQFLDGTLTLIAKSASNSPLVVAMVTLTISVRSQVVEIRACAEEVIIFDTSRLL